MAGIRVRFTRDSVAAGDDVDAPHEVFATFPATGALSDLVTWIVDSHYLAPIAGGKATWVAGLVSSREGERLSKFVCENVMRPIAVLAQESPGSPQWLADAHESLWGTGWVHVEYHAQKDPGEVRVQRKEYVASDTPT